MDDRAAELKQSRQGRSLVLASPGLNGGSKIFLPRSPLRHGEDFSLQWLSPLRVLRALRG